MAAASHGLPKQLSMLGPVCLGITGPICLAGGVLWVLLCGLQVHSEAETCTRRSSPPDYLCPTQNRLGRPLEALVLQPSGVSNVRAVCTVAHPVCLPHPSGGHAVTLQLLTQGRKLTIAGVANHPTTAICTYHVLPRNAFRLLSTVS